MANNEDPTKIPPLMTLVGGVSGGIVGSGYHTVYVRYTGDASHNPVGMFIPVIMLALGFWFITWTVRKPLLSWFPVAFSVFCFGLGGILL